MKKLLLSLIILLSTLCAKSQTITKWDSIGEARAIAIDLNNNVWAAWFKSDITCKVFLSKYDGTKMTYIDFPIENNTSQESVINNITFDDSGNLWLTLHGTDTSKCNLYKFDGTNWTGYNLNRLCNINLSYDIAQRSLSYLNGYLWIACSQYLIQFKDGIVLNKIKIFNAIEMLSDAESNIWWGTSYNFAKWDGLNGMIYTFGPSFNCCWHSSQGFKYEGSFDVSGGLEINKEGYIYGVDSYDGSIFKIKPEVNSYETFKMREEKNPEGIFIEGTALDAENNLWLNNYFGKLYKFDGVKLDSISIDKGGFNIVIDNNGNKWIGGTNGLIRYSDGGPGPLVHKTIRGMVFNDENGNGVMDAGEQGIGNQFIFVNDRISTSDGDGKWACMPTANISTLKYLTKPNWEATTDTVKTINRDAMVGKDTVINFGVRAKQSINDLAVALEGTRTRANFKAEYWLTYKNIGSDKQKGLVSFQYDTRATLVSSKPTADSTYNNQLFWKYDTLASFEQRQISIQLQMPNVEHLGDTLINVASIIGNYNDTDLLNNKDTLKQLITGSYDPNEVVVSPIGKTNEHLTPFDTELTYTIHFQNTGTDTAFNVAVRDTISSLLNMRTFELLSSSHPVQMEVKSGNIMTFRFNNINLPDSAHSQLGSNGFVKYRIKPNAGLAEGTLVTKRAYIYFDMNPAILTNIAFNKYSNGQSFPANVKDYISIISVPNPIYDQGNLLFKNPGNGKYTLRISNLQGMEVMHIENITGTQYLLKRGSLTQGIYLMQLIPQDSGDMLKGKLVVE